MGSRSSVRNVGFFTRGAVRVASKSLAVSTLTMSSQDKGASPLVRAIAGFMVVGLLASSVLPFLNFGSGSVSSSSALVDAKLHNVPVFTVSDPEGRPFLVEAEDHLSRKGYFFIDPHDAEEYLERVREEGSDNAKLLPVGLDEALQLVTKQRTSGRQVPERFSLFPSEAEVAIAREVTGGQFASTFGEDACPLYFADGLAFASSNSKDDDDVSTVYPVFFQKSALDKTLSTLRERDAKAAEAIGEIQVLSLMQTVKEMESGNDYRLRKVMFLPLDESLRALRSASGGD